MHQQDAEDRTWEQHERREAEKLKASASEKSKDATTRRRGTRRHAPSMKSFIAVALTRNDHLLPPEEVPDYLRAFAPR